MHTLAATTETGVTLGSWPDWIAAIATGAAFLIAAITYARSTRDHTEAQARLVYASFSHITHHAPGEQLEMLPNGARMGYGEGTVIVPGAGPAGKAAIFSAAPIIRCSVVIHNRSTELIGPGKLQLRNSGTGKIFDSVAFNFGVVEPTTDDVLDFTIINEVPPAQPSVSPVIIFRDSSGRWWKRDQYEPIERIHDDPNNLAETPAERQERGERIKRLGWGELEPLPKLTLRVKCHRLLRRMRGKPPIP